MSASSSEPAVREDARHQWLLEQYTELASLAGGLAHEIKNPLSTLNLNLQLLAEDFEGAESQKERRAFQKIQTLQRECQRLEDILNDFLRFARVSDLSLEPTDVSQVVQELIDFEGPHAEASGIVLRENLPSGLPPVLLDRDFFKQALLNLMLNAQQAMPNGGELMLKTHADDHHVCVDVIDTGVGMSPETLDKIFRPFYSTRKGGSGLGLSTTKKIVEAHHGRLLVKSDVGKGTAFTIQLPTADHDKVAQA
jgi:signal transduction histidine kinase